MPAHNGGPKPRALSDETMILVQLRCMEKLGHTPSKAGGYRWRWGAQENVGDIVAYEVAR